MDSAVVRFSPAKICHWYNYDVGWSMIMRLLAIKVWIIFFFTHVQASADRCISTCVRAFCFACGLKRICSSHGHLSTHFLLLKTWKIAIVINKSQDKSSDVVIIPLKMSIPLDKLIRDTFAFGLWSIIESTECIEKINYFYRVEGIILLSFEYPFPILVRNKFHFFRRKLQFATRRIVELKKWIRKATTTDEHGFLLICIWIPIGNRAKVNLFFYGNEKSGNGSIFSRRLIDMWHSMTTIYI